MVPVGVKVLLANCEMFCIVGLFALAEVVPYELTWLAILAVPNALRKLFKLNVEALALVLRELDFWVPFVTMLLSGICALASFTHEGAPAALAFVFTIILTYTVNTLFGKPIAKWVCAYVWCDNCGCATDLMPLLSLVADADLAKRVIESKGSKVAKHVVFLLGFSILTILITFAHIPGVENRRYHFHFLYNEGMVESISMCTRFIATPLLFNFKFIVKSLVYKGRTVIIKMPLIRHVMPKREVLSFLRRRAEGRSKNASALWHSILSKSGRAAPETL